MATRYEEIVYRLDKKHPHDRRICPAQGTCACNGCAGWVGAKMITERELKMYLNGDMQKLIEEKNNVS